MHRQADPHRGYFRGRQEQPVPAKIMKAQPVCPKPANHGSQCFRSKQLARNQVMPLQVRCISGLTGNIDAAKWQGFSVVRSGFATQEHLAIILVAFSASRKTTPVPARSACFASVIGPCATSQSINRTATRAKCSRLVPEPPDRVNSCPIRNLSPVVAISPEAFLWIDARAMAGKGPPSSHGLTARLKSSGTMAFRAGIQQIARGCTKFARLAASAVATLITGKSRCAPEICGPGQICSAAKPVP